MRPRLSTDWQLIISGLLILIGMSLVQRLTAPLFGFERGSEGFSVMLSIWWLLGAFLTGTGLVMHALGSRRHHHQR